MQMIRSAIYILSYYRENYHIFMLKKIEFYVRMKYIN